MDRKPKICLVGASFDTGNLGVSALAESSIKCILNRWPDAEIVLLASGRESGERWLKLMGRDVLVHKVPIRFCKNVFLPNHFCVLFLYALLLRLLPQERLKTYLKSRNWHFKQILETDMVANITGGDSFSDIYGMRRFVLGFLCNWLVIFLRKRLILLPQTYGPFRRSLTKALAKYVLNYASLIYSRDQASVEYAKSLLNTPMGNGKVRFAPDVAFILDSQKPSDMDIGLLLDVRTNESVVVGINVSGLLCYGRYAENNTFGLKEDYRRIICRIVDFLMAKKNVLILLVSHMSPPPEMAEVERIENDFAACISIYKEFSTIYPQRIFIVRGSYNHSQIKYIIGLCDFFIGSRMHACIAALSQGIPVVGIAYSKKFEGVFETIGCKQMVADMHHSGTDEILDTVTRAFEQRETIARHLEVVIPEVQKQILSLFQCIS